MRCWPRTGGRRLGHDTVLILGAGPIGVAFAAAFAPYHPVTISETNAAIRATIPDRLADARQAMALAGRPTGGSVSWQIDPAFAGATLVLECGPERLEDKRLMLRQALALFPHAVVATASSAMPVSHILPDPADQPRALVAHARGTGVTILLENVPFTFLPTAQDIKETCALIGPGVGVNFDICNSAYIREDPAAAIRLLGPLVQNVHVSDSGYDEFKHARLGTGIVQTGPAAQALRDIGYTGATVLELITDALAPGSDPDGDIRASHAVLAANGWAALGT